MIQVINIIIGLLLNLIVIYFIIGIPIISIPYLIKIMKNQELSDKFIRRTLFALFCWIAALILIIVMISLVWKY